MTSALILAAGLGTRLAPFTTSRPKVLVEVGGRPILGRLIAACAEAGLTDALVVTGHLSERIADWLGRNAQPIPVRTVYNAAFDSLGNAWSVAVAKEALRGRDFVKLDGDLVLEASILADLNRYPGSALALDTRADLDQEAMKARAASGRITALGKWIPVSEAAGESIGVERICAADAPAVFEALEAIVKTKPNAYYEDAYHQLIEAGRLALAAHDIGDRLWTEIDSPADLGRARALFEGD